MGDLILPLFPQLHPQVLDGVGKNYKECAQGSGQHLDAGGYVRHGWYHLTTQCQISWPTALAALSGIPARPGLARESPSPQPTPSELPNAPGTKTFLSPTPSPRLTPYHTP